MQVDFGFGDVVVPKPVPTELLQLLDLGVQEKGRWQEVVAQNTLITEQ